MALDYNVTTLSNDTLVMVWISLENVAAVAQKGFKVVHAASDYFYLASFSTSPFIGVFHLPSIQDCGAGEWIGADPDGNSWCDPFKTWQHVGLSCRGDIRLDDCC